LRRFAVTQPRRRRSDWVDGKIPTPDENAQNYWVELGATLHQLIRDAALASGEKLGSGLAADVRANPTQFSEALKPNGPKRFAVEWLPRVVVADPKNRILRFLCGLRGMEPKPLPVSSPEEKLRRLVARIESKGAMGRELLREEFGNEADNLVRATVGDAT
jgi:hypothetical protein